MFVFKASLVRFTLIELSRRGRLALLSKITSSREIRSTQKFLLLELLWVKRFAWVYFRWGYNWKQVCFKMSLWEKMLLSIKTAHFNFTLIRLNNKSSPQFIPLNGTKGRLSKVIVHLWILEGQGKPVFLSECNADISSHFSSDHLSKCGDVTEAELIMTS